MTKKGTNHSISLGHGLEHEGLILDIPMVDTATFRQELRPMTKSIGKLTSMLAQLHLCDCMWMYVCALMFMKCVALCLVFWFNIPSDHILLVKEKPVFLLN